MKLATQKFYYPGIFSHWESCCGLEIIEKENGMVYVIMTELGDNPGTSVTNAVENIATKVYNEYLHHVSIENIFWIEHYNKASYRCPENGKETFDHVTLKWSFDLKRFISPDWRPCSKKILSEIEKRGTL